MLAVTSFPEFSQRITLNHFTDGTLKLECKIPNNTKLPFTVHWRYENESELVALIYIVQHLRDHGVTEIHLDMPYIPNARQDRVQNTSEVFTMKHFARVINWLNFDSVKSVDAHSRVSEALLDRFTNISPEREIEDAINRAKWQMNTEEITLFYPDEGAMKRYHTNHEYPKTFGMKTRNPNTGHVDSLKIAGDINDIKGKYVLIVDDICAKGETAYRSAMALRQAGAKGVCLYVTHCENTVVTSKLLNSCAIEQLYTTDSIFTGDHPKVVVM